MSSPVIGDEAGIPVVANAVLGTPNRESISKASSRTRDDWSGAVFMIKRPVLQTGVHVGRLSQAWLNRGVSHPSKCFQPGQDSTWRADHVAWPSDGENYIFVLCGRTLRHPASIANHPLLRHRRLCSSVRLHHRRWRKLAQPLLRRPAIPSVGTSCTLRHPSAPFLLVGCSR